MSNATSSHTRYCDHCGLPAWNAVSEDEFVFCCYGCQMVHTLGLENNTVDLPVPESLLVRWVIALVGSMLLIFLSLTIHFDNTAPAFFPAFSFALSTGIFALLSKELLGNLKREWQSKKFSLGTLIFIGVSASYLLSVVNWIRGSQLIYFETSAMILTFYIGSLLIDIYLKNRISEYTGRWKDGIPSAIIKNGNGLFERQPATSIKTNNILQTEQDVALPVDGNLKSEKGYFREEHLTGEPEPVLKYNGDTVSAGSIPMEDELLLQAVSSYNNSSLKEFFTKQKLIQENISSYEVTANRAAQVLLFFVVVLGIGTALYYALYEGLSIALNHSLSVFLIGCPCAFAIATPAALWVVQQKLEEGGVLLRNGTQTLEELAKANHIIFDKTGTLTQSAFIENMTLHGKTFSKENLVGILAGMEATQQHPIAKAVRRYAKKQRLEAIQLSEIHPIPGLGLKAEWQGHKLELLNNNSEKKHALPEGSFGLFVDNHLQASFGVHYPIKESAIDVMEQLVESGYRVSVLTGDPEPYRELQHQRWAYHGSCSPETKHQFIQKRKEQGDKVCFIGDGINDLLAMTEADISIAMFDGANRSKTTADLVLFNPDFKTIPKMLSASVWADKIIRMNFFWASIYNLTGLSLAIMGLLNPLISILAMVLSSTFVTGNSLRLRSLDFSEL